MVLALKVPRNARRFCELEEVQSLWFVTSFIQQQVPAKVTKQGTSDHQWEKPK